VKGSLTRPTADRVREALFSRLESRYGLSGRRVLDLYAGSGALGIEAMSRGATELVSVELSSSAAAVLNGNIRSCGLEASAEVMVCGAADAIDRLEAAGRTFDAVFMDPPYADDTATAVLGSVAGSAILAGPAFVVWESSSHSSSPDSVGQLVKRREDAYGDTKLTLYERREEK
jgi:16S rRNA (guanine(966)-N(2))-methyltransferase RsmD